MEKIVKLTPASFIVKLTSVADIQLVEYNVAVWCERCKICLKPGTPVLRMICSCGCGVFKENCTRCPFGFVPACLQKQRRREEEPCVKKKYIERKFMSDS